jgi:hypothetical protein
VWSLSHCLAQRRQDCPAAGSTSLESPVRLSVKEVRGNEGRIGGRLGRSAKRHEPAAHISIHGC